MAKLYELSDSFEQLFNQFDAINDYDFDTDADGNPIDREGNIIENPEAYKAAMLEAWFDTLEGIEGEFEDKAENIACYIKSLQSDIDDMDNEEKILKARMNAKKNRLEAIKKYLKNSMLQINLLKIDKPRARLSIRNNAECLVVDDEKAFIEWAERSGNDSLLTYKAPEIRKTDTKKLVQSGREIPNVHLERSQSLIIK